MKKFIGLLFAFVAILSTSVVADDTGTKYLVSAPSQSQPAIVDTWGNVGGAVRDASGAISTGVGTASGLVKGLLLDWINGKDATLAISELLAKIPGMPSGRVIQAAIVDKLGEAAAVVDAAIQTAFTISDAVDAVQRGDKAAYQKVVADYIISMTANIAGTAAGDATFAIGTGATVGAGALPAAIAAAGVGYLVTKGVEWILNKYAREALEDLVGKYWDWLNGTPGKADEGDPYFDGEPEGNKKPPDNTNPSKNNNRYQGLRPLKLID